MEINQPQQFIDFDNIAYFLDFHIQIKNHEMMTKGFVPSNIRKNLRIYVHSNDHGPAHFHIESTQRKFEQKFTINGIENISKDKDRRFDDYVKNFFEDNSIYLEKISGEFYRLNPKFGI